VIFHDRSYLSAAWSHFTPASALAWAPLRLGREAHFLVSAATTCHTLGRTLVPGLTKEAIVIPTALQILVMIFALTPSLPVLAAEMSAGGSLWSALATASTGHRYMLAIATVYFAEMMLRFRSTYKRRPLSHDTVWSFAVVHVIVAAIALTCLGLELLECGSISDLRRSLWGMQYQLAVAGLSAVYAARELIVGRKKRSPPNP
jgi:hypothetical protein